MINIKNLAVIAIVFLSIQLNAQVTMDFEPNKFPLSANCWAMGAMTGYYSSATIINGGLSARTNQLTSGLPTSTWVKSPWLKPGSGNITFKVRLDGNAATTRFLRVRFIPYNSTAGTFKEGVAISDSFNYTFAAPISGAGSTNIRDISYTIPNSIANTNNVYKVMISFMGSGGTGRALIDDILIPGTYWANPSNSCLPLSLITDTDGDGVQDSDDAYPNDAIRAYDNFYPAKTNGTLMFEDLWPSVGDYDFNDLVLGYRYNTVTNSSNNIVEIKYEITPKAIGASLNNAFGFMLDGISYDNIYSVEGLKNEAEWLSLNKNGTEADQKTATIIVFTSANAVLPNPGGSSGVNTDPKGIYVKPTTISFTVRFRDDEGKPVNSDVSTKDFTAENFNPFIIINQVRDQEIHLPTYSPSAKATEKTFGTADDNSKEGNYYKSKNGLPWALNIPAEIPNTIEKVDFLKAYNYFSYWVESVGKEYTDWYEDKEKYRNNDALYIVK
ncbi:MAG: LruC domain-containing protein [Bacteroidia bacterium]